MDEAKVILDLANWQGFVIVLVALLGLFVLVGNAVKTWQDIKRPRTSNQMNEQEILRQLSAQLVKHEAEIKELREGLKVMCVASKAMLEHSIHNGNAVEMEQASKSIDAYLQSKI